MTKKPELVCVGLITIDILGRPIEAIPPGGGTTLIKQIRLTPAGTAAGAAAIAAKLGLQTSLVAGIGRDDMGDFILSVLEKQGVDTAYIQRYAERPTSATILAVQKNGARPNFHAIGAAALVDMNTKTRDLILSCPYIHWGTGSTPKLDNGPAVEILREAHRKGATITCDFIAPVPRTLEQLKMILPYVSYFMPSLEEAMQLAGTKTTEETARFYLDLGAGVCILKWGDRGSFLATRDMQLRIPAYKVDVVDTTGCGDSYCGGFIAALAHGYDLVEACRFGTATAALVATGLGSDAGVVDFAQTEKAMKTLPVLE